MSKKDTNKRAEQIADAIGELPEQMICDALKFEEIKGKQKRKRRHYIEVLSGLAAAAILCIVVLHGSDRLFLQKQTADVDKTEEKVALKGADQKKDVSEEKLDIWCMASGMGGDAAGYEYSDSQDRSSENAGVKKESGRSSQKESREETKDQGSASASGDNTADNDSVSAGEQLQMGERYLLPTNITGSGKNRSVQFTLQFGETDDSVRYQLKVSVVSMDLIAESETAGNRVTLQGNTGQGITCVSGTQIGCSIRVTDMEQGAAIPSISVTRKNKDTGEKVRGEIKVEQKSGKYYLYLTEK